VPDNDVSIGAIPVDQQSAAEIDATKYNYSTGAINIDVVATLPGAVLGVASRRGTNTMSAAGNNPSG